LRHGRDARHSTVPSKLPPSAPSTWGREKVSAKDVIALCRSLSDIGVRHAIFNLPDVHEIRPLEVFGREIIPAVAGL
jgi:hypothetical protein